MEKEGVRSEAAALKPSAAQGHVPGSFIGGSEPHPTILRATQLCALGPLLVVGTMPCIVLSCLFSNSLPARMLIIKDRKGCLVVCTVVCPNGGSHWNVLDERGLRLWDPCVLILQTSIFEELRGQVSAMDL